jgi:hypothetical protein
VAASKGIAFVAVDADAAFLEAVRETIATTVSTTQM